MVCMNWQNAQSSSFSPPFSPRCLRARPGHLALDYLKPPLLPLLFSLPLLHHHLSSFLSYQTLLLLLPLHPLRLSFLCSPLSCRPHLLSKLLSPSPPLLPATGTAGLSIITPPVRGHFTQDPSYCTKIGWGESWGESVQKGGMQ